MAGGGFFGGLASGITAGNQQRIQQQQVSQQGNYQQGMLGIEQQRVQNQQQRALFAQADKDVSNIMTAVQQTIQAGKAAGKDQFTIAKSVSAMVEQAKSLAKAAGRQDAVPGIDAQLAAGLAQPGLGEVLKGIAGVGQQQPRGIRNNNPGNIEAGQFASGQPGYAGSDGRFAKFQTPQQGMDAAGNLIGNYGKEGINTVSGIIQKWAPEIDGNNTQAYTAFVAKKLGVDPNQPLNLQDPVVRNAVAGAIGQFENGPVASPQGAQPAQPTAAQPQDNIAQIGAIANAMNSPMVPPALKAVLATKLKGMIDPSYSIKMITDPVTGVQSPVRINKDTGEMTGPNNTPYTPQSWPQVDPSIHGPQYVAELGKTDQSLANAIKAVGDYTMDPRAVMGFGNPATKFHILGMVKQYNPSYDEKLYDRYHAGNQAWARGGPSSPASQTKSYSVLVSHLGLLRQLTTALGNHDMQTVNALKNRFESEFGRTIPNTIQGVGDIVSDELIKAVLGANSTLSDRQEMKKRVSAASNTEGQMIDLLNKYTQLAHGQLEGLKQQFKAQTGRNDFNSFLTPEAISMFEKQDQQGAAKGAANKKSTAIPPPPAGAHIVSP